MKSLSLIISSLFLGACGLYESEGRYLFEEDFSRGTIQTEPAALSLNQSPYICLDYNGNLVSYNFREELDLFSESNIKECFNVE